MTARMPPRVDLPLAFALMATEGLQCALALVVNKANTRSPPDSSILDDVELVAALLGHRELATYGTFQEQARARRALERMTQLFGELQQGLPSVSQAIAEEAARRAGPTLWQVSRQQTLGKLSPTATPSDATGAIQSPHSAHDVGARAQ